MRKKVRSCLGCLGTLVVLFVLIMAARSQPTPLVSLATPPPPTPTLSAIHEWAHWHAAPATLKLDTAAAWVRRAYPTLSNADLVRLAREVVACVDAAGERVPLADTGASCLLLLRPD